MAEISDLALADAIAAVRSELTKAREAGEREDVRFTVGPVEVEFSVVAKKAAEGKAGLRLGVVTVAAGGGLAKEQTHRVRVTLNPTSSQTPNQSLMINDLVDRIPDR